MSKLPGWVNEIPLAIQLLVIVFLCGVWVGFGGVLFGAYTYRGLEKPPLGAGLIFGSVMGLLGAVAVALAPSFQRGQARLPALAVLTPIFIVAGATLFGFVIVGVPLELMNVWPRMPQWVRITLIVLVSLLASAGLAGAILRDETIKPFVSHHRPTDAAAATGFLGCGCSVILAIIIVAVFEFIDEDPERLRRRREQLWTDEHTPFVWTMIGIGAALWLGCWWGVRSGIRASRYR